MSGLFSVSVAEARGYVAVPADIDKLAVVIGCSSLGSGLSPFYLSGQSAVAGLGYGDGVDCLTQIIEQRQTTGTARKFPAALYSVAGTTTGAYGAINVTGVTGTSVVTVHAATHPFGTYEAYVRVVKGGTIGVAGITLVWSLSAGRDISTITGLGTASTFTIPNSNVQFDFAAGTLVVGDFFTVRTTAPAPAAADIDTAFSAIAQSSIDFSIVACEFPVTATLAAHVTSGIAACRAVGKRATALTRSRIRGFESAETESVWAAAVEADILSYTDSNINTFAAYGFLTDALTSRQYLRSGFAQFAADVVRVKRSLLPNVPADQPMANFTLIDSTGATIGHDEGPRGSVTGLSDDTQGNRLTSVFRLADNARRESVYSTVPWMLYAPDERIRNLAVRRIANAMERVAVTAGNANLGANLFYIPADPANASSRPHLTAASRSAIHASIWSPIKAEFADDVQNAADAALDTGIVQVDPNVTVSGGNLLGVNVTLAPLVFGVLLNLNFTLAVQQ